MLHVKALITIITTNYKHTDDLKVQSRAQYKPNDFNSISLDIHTTLV